MFRYSLCLAAILSLALAGCQKENQFDCLKSTGKTITVTRPLPEFTTLKVEDDAEIILVQDAESFVEIEAGKNLSDNVLTDVKNQELTIRNINKCNWVRSYKNKITITVHTPHLLNVFHNGTKTIRTEGQFKTARLFIHQTGAGDYHLNLNSSFIWLDMYHLGDMKLQGSTDSLVAYQYGLGNLMCRDLATDYASLIMDGSGESTIFSSRFLFALLTGNGNLYYGGNPTEKTIIESGKGKAIRSF